MTTAGLLPIPVIPSAAKDLPCEAFRVPTGYTTVSPPRARAPARFLAGASSRPSAGPIARLSPRRGRNGLLLPPRPVVNDTERTGWAFCAVELSRRRNRYCKGGAVRGHVQGQIVRLVSGCALLLLSLVIALRGGAPVAAGGLPQMATFKTAHLRIDGSLKATSPAENEEITITGQGEGDVDTARNASQGKFALAYTSKAEGKSERETLEMVVVDGRTYWYDPKAKQWVWVDNGPGGGGATLSPAFDDPKQFGADQFAFVRVGP